jgi:RNA polymerase sigma-70 factor (ECF subfamily)
MIAVAAADPRAQTELVERLAGRVRRLARLLSGPGEDPDDAAQVALLEILKSARNFHDATNLEAWADRITVRAVARTRRRERLRARLFTRWLIPGSLPWGAPASTNPREDLECDRLLSSLPEPRRIAFVLRHVLGCSVDEIAELTAAPPGSVKDRLVSARRHLKKWVAREAKRGRT